MHELGIVYEVIKVVENFRVQNAITQVDKIVLEIGQLSQAVPRFIKECYPAAIDNTMYENTELEILSIEAIGECRNCDEVYNVVNHQRECPKCRAKNYKLISGQEFNIKEIIGY